MKYPKMFAPVKVKEQAPAWFRSERLIVESELLPVHVRLIQIQQNNSGAKLCASEDFWPLRPPIAPAL